MSKVTGIGLIVEDDSDFEIFKNLIKRISGKENIKFRKAIGNGCGRIKRKASSYAANLSQRGCNLIILVHDLDRNNHDHLKNDLETELSKSPAKFNFVCIPIEEVEAWFLSDPQGLKEALTLKRVPKIPLNPEVIKSPKEKLGEIIFLCSEKEKIYLNTKHNSILSSKLSIEEMEKKCESFAVLSDYIKKQKY